MRKNTDPFYQERRVAYLKKWRSQRRAVIGAGKRTNGFKSEMEDRVIGPWLASGALYEPYNFRFPIKIVSRYTPDVVLPNGIVIEVKGWWTGASRKKLEAFKRSYPDLELRMVLATPRAYITTDHKTTQAEWCNKRGIPWAEKEIPASWLLEPDFPLSLAILAKAPRVVKGGK